MLALRGAAVTLTARDLAAGESAAAQIRQSTGNQAVDVRPLELADPVSVAAFVDRWDGPLDILVNNAGVMAIRERTLTPGGDELHFATNHLGHFALTIGLADALRASGDARIVSVEAGTPTELKTIAQGAATSVLAAASPLAQGIGGRYLEDCQEAQTLASRAEGDARHGVAPYTLDADNAQRLWDTSEQRLTTLA